MPASTAIIAPNLRTISLPYDALLRRVYAPNHDYFSRILDSDAGLGQPSTATRDRRAQPCPLRRYAKRRPRDSSFLKHCGDDLCHLHATGWRRTYLDRDAERHHRRQRQLQRPVGKHHGHWLAERFVLAARAALVGRASPGPDR